MGRGGTTTTLMRDFLRETGGCAVLDGGLATELEANGADLNDPLWSAKCLISSPHLIRKVSPLSFCFFSIYFVSILTCNYQGLMVLSAFIRGVCINQFVLVINVGV